MARVQWNGTETVTVPELGKVVKPGDIVEVPDDRFEGYVPAKEHRAEDHPWSAIEAPAGKPAKKTTTSKAKD